ncbi:hypothetical protein JMN32_05205 [Fulvivirga sp. 29W222]|uniref:Uncharacterized protein n=1 Tax=Fulvivirga marina TaxID=2494733 RepID=A0A937FWJ6_9BACT|nr:hypothetical protein [Fulvivirga marina]MBL6445695.1 hypothetical protein [Fulvivirga marina]
MIDQTIKENVLKPNNAFWVENIIKARIAETIIKELFRSLGYEVYYYGMENSVPALTNKLSRCEDETSLGIRRMPDLVVFDQNRKRSFYIEVKFKADGAYSKVELKENPYDSAFVVVVTKKHIKCLTVKEIKEGKKLRKYPDNYLGDRPEFEFSEEQREMIKSFCDYALKYYQCV